jgi:hypothetical protein
LGWSRASAVACAFALAVGLQTTVGLLALAAVAALLRGAR